MTGDTQGHASATSQSHYHRCRYQVHQCSKIPNAHSRRVPSPLELLSLCLDCLESVGCCLLPELQGAQTPPLCLRKGLNTQTEIHSGQRLGSEVNLGFQQGSVESALSTPDVQHQLASIAEQQSLKDVSTTPKLSPIGVTDILQIENHIPGNGAERRLLRNRSTAPHRLHNRYP